MKKLLVIIILSLFFSSSQADEIRDFQIEGMSIGDSLLDHFSEETISSSKKNWFNHNEYTIIEIFDKSLIFYDSIQASYKTNDIRKKIAAIDGLKFYKNINSCKKKLDNVAKEIKNVTKGLKDLGKETYKHQGDKSGKSLITDYVFESKNQDEVQVACYDWSESSGSMDHLRVGVRTIDYRNFLRNKAYK